MSISRIASVMHTTIILSLFALALLAGIAATPVAEAANSCEAFQASKSVSGTLTTLTGTASCQEKCTAYASQIGAAVNCQMANIYVSDPPIWMCMPDPFGNPLCGYWDPGTGTTVQTCQAGAGAITAGANNQSAASCAYVPSPALTVTANPTTVQNGGTVILSWTSSNAVSCDAVSSGATNGSKTQVVNSGSGSSVTYSIKCVSSSGESVTKSVVVNVSNPNTPANCTVNWNSGQYPTGAAVSSVAMSGSDNCQTICANYSETYGGTYSCGVFNTSSVWGIGGHNYNGSGGTITNTSTCNVMSGSGLGATPATAGAYSANGNNYATMEEAGTAYDQCIKSSNGSNPVNCIVSTYEESYYGYASCTSAPTGSPDLRASAVLPATAVAGQAVTLSATVANIGAAPTTAGFTNLFQVSNAADGSGATDIGTHNNAMLAASASNAATRGYTFATAGTYYVRACADKSSAANTGTVTESDEANNCSAWTAISVLSPLNLNANALTYTGTVQEGQSLSLTGTVLNNGTVATGIGFNSVFEYRLGNSGGFTGITTVANAALNGGENRTNPGTFIIPGGTGGQVLWVQYCVDSGNVIVESNETVADNCRQVNLGVVGSSGPTSVVLEASINGGGWSSTDQQTVNSTDSVVLRWASSGATSCSGTGSSFSASGVNGFDNVDTPPANSSVVFAVNCTGPTGGASDALEILTRQLPNLTVAQNASPRFGTFDGATQSYSEVEIFFRTQNSGGADAGSAVDYRLEFDSNKDGDYADAGETIYRTNGVGMIAAASGENDSEVIPGPISFGPHNVRITVDASGDPGKVDETDDVTDNVHQGTVTIAPVDPGLSLNSNVPQVQNNGTVTLTWAVSNPYSMSCIIFGPKLTTTTPFNPTDAAAQKFFTTGPLTAKSEYTLSCDAAGTTFTDTVIVETQGVIEEI